MLEELKNAPRLLMEASLKPLQGDRFQPTGFPDLGAAVYERADGTRMLLVDSAQSMANRFELTCMEGNSGLVESLRGLPYVVAHLTGDSIDTFTSSLLEAHRLNSPYIIANDDFRRSFLERSGYDKGAPLDWQKIAHAILFYDPNSLLHGVFMANLLDGRMKMPRALGAFIEAQGVREVASGGVKNNPLDPKGKLQVVSHNKNVYSNVPYHRIEFTAEKMTAYFNVDLALLRGYKLGPEATSLLIALALYKVRRFLETGLRLRTACDLVCDGGLVVTEPAGLGVPEERDLLQEIREMIDRCTDKGLFADPPVTVLETAAIMRGGTESGVSDQGDGSSEGEEGSASDGEE